MVPGHRAIFNEDQHRRLFLKLFGELNRMFREETHAYCLMGNHDHLLNAHPVGNLQRRMRHLNGVSTQRYNPIENTDGPPFRGCHKAILIEPDAYSLNVRRYIHLNPVAAGLVERASDFPWSSYGEYVGKAPAPYWLNEIASNFGMIHYASASVLVTRCRQPIEFDRTLANTIADIVKTIKAKI